MSSLEWMAGKMPLPRNHPDYIKEYYQKNKDKIRETAKRYREKNREKTNESRALWKQNNPQRNIWSNAKYRAKRIGLEFNLEVEDIVIPEYCPYLGTKLTFDKLKGHLDSHASLDRIDSSKGYIKGNVEVISYKANMMKQDASREQLLKFASCILEKFKNEDNIS